MNTLQRLAISTCLFAFLLPSLVCAQTWPAKSVRVIVPSTPGSGIDITLRLFMPKVGEVVGQQFVLDYRTGAAGTIGAALAASAAPDGYTLFGASASLASSQSLYKNLTYDLARDFAPMALLSSTPFLFVVHPSLPVRNVKELIALAKVRRGDLSFASNGTGGALHLTGELLKMQTGIDMFHVPYKGNPQALTDVMAGQVSMMFINFLSVIPHVKTGRVRAIATSSAARNPAIPELPTVAESGLPGFESGTWYALLAPVGTSRDIVMRINTAVSRVLQMADLRDRVVASGGELLGGTPEHVGAYVRNEIAKWGKVISAAHVQPD
jgi:tripartite-type tricarboxylate transporter receptor subunit TctC